MINSIYWWLVNPIFVINILDMSSVSIINKLISRGIIIYWKHIELELLVHNLMPFHLILLGVSNVLWKRVFLKIVLWWCGKMGNLGWVYQETDNLLREILLSKLKEIINVECDFLLTKWQHYPVIIIISKSSVTDYTTAVWLNCLLV